MPACRIAVYRIHGAVHDNRAMLHGAPGGMYPECKVVNLPEPQGNEGADA